MVAEAAVVIALLAVPLIVTNTYDSFALPKMLVLVACAALCVPFGRISLHQVDTAVVMVMTAFGISTMVALNHYTALVGNTGRYRGLAMFLACAVIYFAIRRASPEAQELFLFTIVVTGTIVAAVSYVAYWQGGRASGTIGNAVTLGGYLLVPTLIAAAHAHKSKVYAGMALFMGSSMVFAAQSRWPLIALAIGLFLILDRKQRWTVPLAIIGSAAALILLRPDMNVLQSFDMRIFHAHIAMDWWVRFGPVAWVLGAGLDTFEVWFMHPVQDVLARADSAHSVPVQILVSTGIVGLLAWTHLWYQTLTARMRYEWAFPVLLAVFIESLQGILTAASLLLMFAVIGVSVESEDVP